MSALEILQKMAQHDPTCIEVLIDENVGDKRPDEPVAPPRPCQLVPSCKEGNHIAQSGHGGTDLGHRRIGKYFFSEDALKHDLAALRRGKVYTKQEFYRRARAWYKAEIDRILHWHKVYKENNPEIPHKAEASEPKAEPIENTNKREGVEEDKMMNGLPHEDGKKQEAENREQIKKELEDGKQQQTEAIQAAKPKSRQKKVKLPSAPTRVQPSRAVKRKPEEPPLKPKVTRKKKNKVEEPAKEAVKPTPTDTKEQQPQPKGEAEKTEETKGDYELSLDEWKIFLARYNSATSPVLPKPSPTFSQSHLQGIDVANFSMRLGRIIETKIMDLIDERQGITIDEAAGGLCLRGYYHHPFRCALDGNYVPPPRFEPAGAYSPGEDWRPPVEGDGESQKRELANPAPKPASPATYRPPGSRSRIQGKIPPPSLPPQQHQQPPPTVITKPQTHPSTPAKGQGDTSPSIPPPPPNSPFDKPSWPIREANSTQQRILNPEITTTSSARNSPAPDASMEISPTLGRWRPPTTGFPTEDFAEAIVDVSGLRFAVDLCAEYVVDGNGARFFML